MSKKIIPFIVVSILFGVVGYLATSDFIVAIVISLTSLIYFLFRVVKLLTKCQFNVSLFHECYKFINSFIVSISVKASLPGAFESTNALMDESYKKVYQGISDFTENEKLEYLEKYFHFHVYSLFLHVVKMWIEQGGNILEMSSYLINEVTNVEECVNSYESMAKRQYIEFITLWFFTLVILIILRFALSQFYTYINNQIFFKIAIVCLFLFLLFSVEFMLSKTLKYDIKGWDIK